MTQHQCACGTPCRHATLCPACGYKLDETLAEIAAHHGLGWDLDIAIARQDRITRPTTARRPRVADRDETRQLPGTLRPTEVPYSSRAASAARNLRSVLAAWADRIATETGIKSWKAPRHGGPYPVCGHRCTHGSCSAVRPPVPPPTTTTGLASWLRPRVGWLRHHPSGQTAYDEIRAAVRRARATIDRPAEKAYAGPCDSCGEDLYARIGAAYVECAEPDCGQVYEVEARRQWLLRAAEDVLATAPEIARAITSLGDEVTPSAIRGYVHRGQLVSHGTRRVGGREVPLYRMGDVLDVLARRAAQAQT